jgi:hypothetical protein
MEPSEEEEESVKEYGPFKEGESVFLRLEGVKMETLMLVGTSLTYMSSTFVPVLLASKHPKYVTKR